MSDMRSVILTGILLSATMLCPSTAQAITIQQFDKMTQASRSEYVADLIQAVEKSLTDAGNQNDAAAVSRLFVAADGMDRFMLRLAMVRVNDAKKGEESDVADVMALTLEKARIKVPDGFFKLADMIKPKLLR